MAKSRYCKMVVGLVILLGTLSLVEGTGYAAGMMSGSTMSSSTAPASAAPAPMVPGSMMPPTGTVPIFWRNTTTGENAVWYMNGATMIGNAMLSNAGSSWRMGMTAMTGH